VHVAQVFAADVVAVGPDQFLGLVVAPGSLNLLRAGSPQHVVHALHAELLPVVAGRVLDASDFGHIDLGHVRVNLPPQIFEEEEVVGLFLELVGVGSVPDDVVVLVDDPL
jgi:hypothetical protein